MLHSILILTLNIPCFKFNILQNIKIMAVSFTLLYNWMAKIKRKLLSYGRHYQQWAEMSSDLGLSSPLAFD
jgi:hypothetical protein